MKKRAAIDTRHTDMIVHSMITGIHALVCLILLFSSPLFCSSYDRDIDSAYRVVFADVIGYALIGEKPISHDYVQDYYLATHPQVCETFITSLKGMFKDSRRYILKVFEFDSSSGKKNYEIELIHRQALRNLVSKNAYIQAYIKRRFGHIDQFYRRIEDPTAYTFKVIHDELIAGILFGYGEENAKHYCRISSLGAYLNKRPYVNLYGRYIGRLNLLLPPNFPGKIILPYIVKVPTISEGFKSLDEEWEYVQSVDVDVARSSAAEPPYFVHAPIYIARKGAQSEAIQAKFMRAREKLAKIFDGKSYQQSVEDEARKKIR